MALSRMTSRFSALLFSAALLKLNEPVIVTESSITITLLWSLGRANWANSHSIVVVAYVLRRDPSLWEDFKREVETRNRAEPSAPIDE